jgi:hypothetical protein
MAVMVLGVIYQDADEDSHQSDKHFRDALVDIFGD